MTWNILEIMQNDHRTLSRFWGYSSILGIVQMENNKIIRLQHHIDMNSRKAPIHKKTYNKRRLVVHLDHLTKKKWL